MTIVRRLTETGLHSLVLSFDELIEMQAINDSSPFGAILVNNRRRRFEILISMILRFHCISW